MIGYVKHFDSNKTMSFRVSDNKVLKKHNKIWEKISDLLNIEFDSEPVYGDGDKYTKIKIKMYGDRVNTNFQGKRVLKKNASYKCFLLIMLDSVIRVNKKYYPQTLLEECKYVISRGGCRGLLLLPMQHPETADINFQSCVFVSRNAVNKIVKLDPK